MISPDTQKIEKTVTETNKSVSSGLDWLMQSAFNDSIYTVVNLPMQENTPEQAINDVLSYKFPLIEIAEFTGGPRAVIRGTRVAVSTVIGYLLMGETLQTIQKEILPSLNSAQLFEAIQYYAEHRAEIAKEIEANQEAQVRKRLPKFI